MVGISCDAIGAGVSVGASQKFGAKKAVSS